jgi:hypothetical protein
LIDNFLTVKLHSGKRAAAPNRDDTAQNKKAADNLRPSIP